jgi:cysteine desulfurase
MKRVYLDHNATTPVHEEARNAMLGLLSEGFGNPSSLHWAGREAAPHLKLARRQCAGLINASPEEVVFTSGGSEGDNMAIKGVLMKAGKGSHCITSEVEHPAVYSTCKFLEPFGFDVTYVRVDQGGVVDPEEVRRAMRPGTALVSVMLANNETGAINPIKEIASIAREHGALIHTDAVQGVGKIPMDVKGLGVDMLTASGHKYGAPKGVGFQYVRKGVEIFPLISGGHHEHGLRAGTENVPGIAALGAAGELAMRGMDERAGRIGAMRDRLEAGILVKVPGARVNGDPARRIYNTINMSFRGLEGEALMALLDSEGIAVSTGSACSSGEPSRILGAMGLDALSSRGALRFSLGYDTSDEDIDYVLEVLPRLANRLLEMSPVKD